MVFTINGRDLNEYQLSNEEILQLMDGDSLTPEQRECLNKVVFEKFKHRLCPRCGETNDDVFVRFFSDFVNGKMHSKEVVAGLMAKEHRYLQNEMFKVCFAYIGKLACSYMDNKYDDRNRHACRLSYEIQRLLREENLM